MVRSHQYILLSVLALLFFAAEGQSVQVRIERDLIEHVDHPKDHASVVSLEFQAAEVTSPRILEPRRLSAFDAHDPRVLEKHQQKVFLLTMIRMPSKLIFRTQNALEESDYLS